MLQRLSHPFIVKYHDCFTDSQNLYIVMEYVDGGSLKDKLIQCVKYLLLYN